MKRSRGNKITVFGADWLEPVNPAEDLPAPIAKAAKNFQWEETVVDGRLPRSKKHILVLGHGDPESGSVIHELRLRKKSFVALNFLELMTEGQIEITSDGIGRVVIGKVTEGVVDINLASLESVFYTPAPFFPPWPSLEAQNQWTDVDILFWRWLQFLEALQLFVPAKAWVPGAPERLGYPQQRKLQDLALARSLGLPTPDWIMTTQRHALETFSLENGPVIFRDSLRHIERKKKEWTFIATPKFLGQFDWEGLSEAPHVFQAFVHKRAEYRVVIVGNQTFTMKITALQESGPPDWRTEQLKNLRFTKAKLAPGLQKKLVKIAQARSLRLATIDLLQDRHGNFIFLEMNRPGKWLFLELLTKMEITKALVKELA